jgi:hypothetical protein
MHTFHFEASIAVLASPGRSFGSVSSLKRQVQTKRGILICSQTQSAGMQYTRIEKRRFFVQVSRLGPCYAYYVWLEQQWDEYAWTWLDLRTWS